MAMPGTTGTSPKEELLDRLLFMRDKCGIDPNEALQTALYYDEITLADAIWLAAKLGG